MNATNEPAGADALPWPVRVTRHVGAGIRAARQARGWRAQDLADRIAELGGDVGPTVLMNIESGRMKKAGVTVPELLVIAAALEVSPATLLTSPNTAEAVEVSPGREVAPSDAFAWFAGMAADEYGRLHHEHAAAVAALESAGFHLTAAQAPEDGASVPSWLRDQSEQNVHYWQRAVREAAAEIQRVEDQMSANGWPVPPSSPSQTAWFRAVLGR